ncbi:hypothetical protein [uncultured Clostridium sp.]|uniref:hypothetical protein n=1 Tax=uncultured Clostridium sp. TaxID=59620 RepID=UPI0028EB39B9|nr:hypothetical protein [uncultured Clostridium sp.]
MLGGIEIKVDSLLNALKSIPEESLKELAVVSTRGKIIKGKIELIIKYKMESYKIYEELGFIGAKFEDLGYNFGIITINVKDINKISNIPGIDEIELPRTIYFDESSYDCKTLFNGDESNSIIGFITSGISYNYSEFIDDKGESRIDYIYDLSQMGKIWDRNDINIALKNQNPMKILHHKDELGYGNYMVENVLKNIREKSSIIMVKATPGKNITHTKNTLIMKGIKYLMDKKRELKKPLIIYSAFNDKYNFSYNDSLFSQYIDMIIKEEEIKFILENKSKAERIYFKKGKINNFQSIPFGIKPQKGNITLQLHKEFLNNYTLEIVNPLGNTSGLIELSQGYINGSIGEDKYHIYNTGPKSYNINGEIVISIVSNEDVVDEGQWRLNIVCKDEYRGRYALSFI